MSTVKLFNMAHNVNKAEYILIMLIYLTNTPSHRASPSMLTEQSCRAPTERFPPSAQQKLLGGLLGRMLGGTIYERSVETARWALGRNARRRSVGLVVYLWVLSKWLGKWRPSVRCACPVSAKSYLFVGCNYNKHTELSEIPSVH